jgi:hypothetical protein
MVSKVILGIMWSEVTVATVLINNDSGLHCCNNEHLTMCSMCIPSYIHSIALDRASASLTGFLIFRYIRCGVISPTINLILVTWYNHQYSIQSGLNMPGYTPPTHPKDWVRRHDRFKRRSSIPIRPKPFFLR